MANMEDNSDDIPIRPSSPVFLTGIQDRDIVEEHGSRELVDDDECVVELNVKKRTGDVLENAQKKTVKGYAKCWDHFRKIMVCGVQKAKCIHCGSVLTGAPGKGTTHLNRHVANCYTKKQPKIDNAQKTINRDKNEDGTTPMSLREFDVNIARYKLTKMVVKHELPLQFVEYDDFRDLMSYCNPLVKVMSRNTLKREILNIYQTEKVKAMELLEINESRVAITTDMWTSSNQKKGYMVVTAHFIDQSWSLQNRILRFIYVPAPHTSECLSQVLMKCMLDWNIDRKLSTVTLDNCSTNDAMVSKLLEMIPSDTLILRGKLFHMRCAAHILNLIVKDGMAVIGGGIEKIRDSVAYWSASPKRVETFQMAARQLLIKCERKLALDCPTRWNSTFAMLDVALFYRSVFTRVHQLEPQYKSLPSDEEWEMAVKMVEYLRPFYLLTEIFSGRNYPTANLFFPMVCKMKISLLEWQLSPILQVKDMASTMMEKFDKYWKQIHGVLVMGVILDPRFKMIMIEFYFPQIYGVVAAAGHIKKARDFAEEVIKYYEDKSMTMNDGAASSSSPLVGSHNIFHSRSGVLDFSEFKSFAAQSEHKMRMKSDLELYLDEPLADMSPDFDILHWWKANKGKYPVLAEIAKDILAIPVTTVASESAFSTGGRFVSPHRSRLHPDTLEALMCTQHWLWAAERGIVPEEQIFNGEEVMGDDDITPQELE